MRPLSDAGDEAGAVRRLERPPEARLSADELADRIAHRAGLPFAQVGSVVEEVAHRLAKLGLPHDLLLRPAAGVHVHGRRARNAAPEPAEALRLSRRSGRVALAVAEDTVDAVAGATRELGQVLLRRHVEVGEVDDIRRQRPAAVVGVGGHDDDPREVDAGQGSEVDHLAVGDPVAHLCQQPVELVRGAVPNRRDDAQRGLVRHGLRC